MAVNRVSTYGMHQVTLNNAVRLQNSIFDTQTQVSSGFKSQNFEGLNGDVEKYTTLENSLAKSDKYVTNNTLIQGRLDTTNTVLSEIIDTANEAKNLVLQRRNQSTAGSLDFSERMNAYFKTIAGQLNISQEGRYLFSGASTDQRPVDDTILPKLAVAGIPDDGYYRGSKKDIITRIQDEFELKYNVRADDPGFQDIIAGLSVAQEGDAEKDDVKLSQGFELIQKGIDRVINIQASVATSTNTIDTANERHKALTLYFKGLRDDTINADVISLSTRLAVDQGVLQASFQVFAKINSLRLSDYLK